MNKVKRDLERSAGRRPYGGYYCRHEVREDTELTHVGPRTPCGEYLRRFWQPVALSSELNDLPLRVRMLGEDLVLFRTREGEIGLLDAHCSHRGSSLEFGIPTKEGIRCCYHGWHYRVDGTILETPNDPNSKIRHRHFHGAYPTHEFRGIVFAYLGPEEESPTFPHFDTYDIEDNEMVPFSLHYPCNWLQVYENTQDPVHSVFLHMRTSGTQFAESWGEIPVLDYVNTPLGMMNVNVRRWKDKVWVRTTEAVLPNINQAGALWEEAEKECWFLRVSLTRWMRPMDDTNTMIIGWRHFNDRVDPGGKGDRTLVGKQMIDFIGQIEDREYEERQRYPGDYEAIVSQRPIAIHALETLNRSDKGVTKLRGLIRRGIRATRNSEHYSPSYGAGVIPTYTQDTILNIPPVAGKDDDALLYETGQKLTSVLFDTHNLTPIERDRSVEQRVQQLSGNP